MSIGEKILCCSTSGAAESSETLRSHNLLGIKVRVGGS